jgi:hypothetical protein
MSTDLDTRCREIEFHHRAQQARERLERDLDAVAKQWPRPKPLNSEDEGELFSFFFGIRKHVEKLQASALKRMRKLQAQEEAEAIRVGHYPNGAPAPKKRAFSQP